MGKIFYVIGKSSTGKDTIYNSILSDKSLNLNPIIMYTTRPKRDGETDGVTYNYVTDDGYKLIKESGHIIEERAYNTVHGIWRYFTVEDNQIDLTRNDYIIIGVLNSYTETKKYFGSEIVIPIYIEVDDGERLLRAVKREMLPQNQKYAELCRRYLADMDDFSDEKLTTAGIDKHFINDDINTCIREIKEYIISNK